MKGSWWIVDYPNGWKRVYALNKEEARLIAVERWGTEPTHIEVDWGEK